MKEKDIRPNQFEIENKRLMAEDTKEMLKQKDKFVRVSCPACGQGKTNMSFTKSGFEFVVCRNCETLFVNPRPTQEMLARYYASSKGYKHFNDYIFPASEKARIKNIFLPRALKVIEYCEKYKIPLGKLVDVGAGFGTFCEVMADCSKFKEVIAIEPAKSLAASCRRKGVKVYEQFVEKLSLSDANVVTSFESIEHLFWPKEFILSCASLLSIGGIIYITTPNIKGFDMLMLGRDNDNIIVPNHLNYFNPQSLSGLLTDCGFEIMEISTPGLLDV
ncbi:MAG: class I SAM-dependent methyltransferase, partial [Candidatus Omnitrophica bacterium]|nr:class I SAM-dependent methyltransferase [Candidatus Omnitrophota bacterium]